MSSIKKSLRYLPVIGILLPTLSFAGPALQVYGDAHIAWLLVASVLVLFMTVPGLALCYGGQLRSKNALSMIAQCFVATAIATLLWVWFGYDLCFAGSGLFIGHIGKPFLLTLSFYQSSISNTYIIIFSFFQMGFAVIAPALFVGAFAERMKFLAVICFIILWEIFVYYPVAHWVWGGGFLQRLGVLDFAGGTVVHIDAGIAGLVGAIMVGRRLGFMEKPDVFKPNNLTISALGVGILWIGWFGFNAGSANTIFGAAIAAMTTQIATAAGVLTWMMLGWMIEGKPSLMSILSGALAGLVAITPAAGYVGLLGAFMIGIVASMSSFFCIRLKRVFKYDDALDIFGVHGVSGIVGSLLTGVFFAKMFGGAGHGDFSIGHQVLIQLAGIVIVVVWCAVVSFILFFILKHTIGLRISQDDEIAGLDVADHGEMEDAPYQNQA